MVMSEKTNKIDNFQSCGEIESNRRFEFDEGDVQ